MVTTVYERVCTYTKIYESNQNKMISLRQVNDSVRLVDRLVTLVRFTWVILLSYLLLLVALGPLTFLSPLASAV